MPPFRLELPDRSPGNERKVRIIYTKNEYIKGIKITDWQKYLEAEPADFDPYCPGDLNLLRSHYKRLGTDDPPDYSTTTEDMLKQVFSKQIKLPPEKCIANYYTLNENFKCGPEYGPLGYCEIGLCADNYSTTMQDDYSTPYPYVMHRIAFPIKPFLLNRRLKTTDPRDSPYKFYDDGFFQESKCLRHVNAHKSVVFNPITGETKDYNQEAKKNHKVTIGNWGFKL